MKKYPIADCMKMADESVLKTGGYVHQKFECNSCKYINYIDIPNTFYAEGKCEDCSNITDIVKDGCNYLAVYQLKING